MYLIQNSLAVKKVCSPEEVHCEKRCEIQGGSQILGYGNTNSPELSLLNFLPLAYHHSHFLAPNSPELLLLNFLPLAYHQAISWLPPWISHLFSQWPFSGPHFFFKAELF